MTVLLQLPGTEMYTFEAAFDKLRQHVQELIDDGTLPLPRNSVVQDKWEI